MRRAISELAFAAIIIFMTMVVIDMICGNYQEVVHELEKTVVSVGIFLTTVEV